MISSRKRLMTVAGMAVTMLMLTACGAGERDSSSGSGGGSGQSAAASKIIDPLTKEISWPKPGKLSEAVDVKGKTIWWVPIGDSIPSIHAQGVGFTKAVEAAGGTVKLCDGKFNPSDIGNCLSSAARQNAGAVVTNFIDYGMVSSSFDALKAAGVPALLAGVSAPDGVMKDKDLAFYDTTRSTILMTEAVAAGAVLAGGDSPRGLAFVLTDSNTTLAATKAGVKKWEALCPGCPLETVEFSTANVDKLSSQVSATLAKNPDINVALVPDDSFVARVEQAARTVGKDKVKVVSVGGNLANLKKVQAGSQAGAIAMPPIYHGWEITNALFELLVDGEVKSKTNLTARYFKSSNIGSLTLTDDAFLTDKWYGDESYQDAFAAAWGLN